MTWRRCGENSRFVGPTCFDIVDSAYFRCIRAAVALVAASSKVSVVGMAPGPTACSFNHEADSYNQRKLWLSRVKRLDSSSSAALSS